VRGIAVAPREHAPRALGDDIRPEFPLLAGAPALSYLDNAATTQKPRQVIDAVADAYRSLAAPVHRGLYPLAENATAAYEDARSELARFVGTSDRDEVVFTRSATEGINLVARGWARPRLRPGDRIVATRMEHHSNLLPWQQVCGETGAELHVVELEPDGTLAWRQDDLIFDRRTRLIALTHVSNVLGTINPVAQIVRHAHANGIAVVVDAAQAVAHLPIDVQALGCDFLAFSGHKMYGPDGIGVLYMRRSRQEETAPLLLGGGMVDTVGDRESTWLPAPARFEAGSPNLAGAIGFAAAARFVARTGLDNVARHVDGLTVAALEALSGMAGVDWYGPSRPRAGIVSFNLNGVHPHDLAQVAGEMGVAIRAGHHCCQPLMETLGVAATARASFALYNSMDDVARLVHAIETAWRRYG
jgi:cysteine desulfurase/selenocysteine lyase